MLRQTFLDALIGSGPNEGLTLGEAMAMGTIVEIDGCQVRVDRELIEKYRKQHYAELAERYRKLSS